MELIGLSLSIFFIILLLVLAGYHAWTPVVVVVGAAIGGALTQEEKDGAIIGVFIAVSVPVIAGIVALIWSSFATFQQLFVPPPLEASLTLVIVMLVLIIILSAIAGAFGGFVGKVLFKDQKGRILSGFGGLTRIPPPVKDTLVCLACGTANAPHAQYCDNCGAKLRT